MKRISEPTVKRLSHYYRTLTDLMANGQKTVSSQEIAEINDITAAQVRKDLSYFGSFGKRGKGYNIEELHETIGKILGLNRHWNVALVGFGNIARALLKYNEFKKQGFFIQAVFEADENKTGKTVDGVDIVHINDAASVIASKEIEIAIIAVPAREAQKVIDYLSELGIKAFLNFATTRIRPPEGVVVKNENMSVELEALSYFLTNKEE